MKLKNATLIAVIGSILGLIAGLYYMLSSFEVFKYNQPISQLINTIGEISSMCLLVFFIVLYQNQKK